MPPLRIGFWGRGDLVSVSWDPALDPESGVAHYELELVEEGSTARCGHKQTDWTDGRVVSRLPLAVNCSVTSAELVTRLEHGARYHVVLQATNGAGLSARVISRSFVADLFHVTDVASLQFLDPKSVANLTLHPTFEALLDPFGSAYQLSLYSLLPAPPALNASDELEMPPALPPGSWLPPSTPPLLPPMFEMYESPPCNSSGVNASNCTTDAVVVVERAPAPYYDVQPLSPLDAIYFG